jgi:DNA-binding transcriptional regulator YiaG
MANLATLLKEEITRLVRRQLRQESDALKQAAARTRGEIAQLKRQVAALQKQVGQAQKQLARPPVSSAATAAPTVLRFRPAGLKKQRERLGLSAPLLAEVFGVSAQTIYNWEAGTSRPNKDQLAKVALLRSTHRRDVQAWLRARHP